MIGASMDVGTVSPTRMLRNKVRAGYAPPPSLKVSEFADREITLSSGPLAGTRWQTDFAPYQRGIMDAFHEPGVEIVAVMGSSQWGKTSCCVNIVAYHIAHDPCSILVVEPTVDPMAKDFAKNRLDPVIAASPLLRDTVSKKRAKDASNTVLAKTFRGGSIAIGGANSAASLAARSTRLLVLDEVDRYPPELPGEGSTLAIAFKRTAAYGRRRRILLVSSPTLQGAPIDVWFQRGDQRRYFVPCPVPECGTMHPFMWKQLRFDQDDPATARLHCPACDHAMTEAERLAILGRGEWRATTERADPAVVSFHMWEAYSPMSSLREIVTNFLRARALQKAGDKAEMHTWQNTTLGEPVEPDRGDGIEPGSLLLRREQYGSDLLPAGVCCLTMGIDTQDDRLEVLVLGWGPGEESWLIDRHTLPGDTSRPEPWEMLDEVIGHEYAHPTGVKLPISASCIDSAGHRTDFVYAYGLKQAARRLYVIIGREGQRPIVSSPSPRKWGKNQRPIPLYTVGIDAAKAIIVSRLGLTKESGDGRDDLQYPGYVHLPHAEWCDEELVAQLASERLVTKFSKGVPVTEWRKIRARNEALDNFVYGLAALRLLHPDLQALQDRLNAAPAPPAAAPPPAKTPWLGPRRGGWLRGNR